MKKLWMLRYWLMTLLGAVSLICLVAYHQHQTSEQYRGHRSTYCAAFSKTTVEEAACIEERESAKDYQKWWFILISWPEGISTWAIILTGAFIAWQSKETRRSANAAYVALQVMRNKEKPRFTVAMGGYDLQGDRPLVHFSVTARCPTIAYIKSATAGTQTVAQGKIRAPHFMYALKDFPTTVESSLSLPQLEVLAAGEAIDSDFSRPAYEKLVAREVCLVFQVDIVFEDNFGSRRLQVCKVLEATGLRNFDKTPFMTWSDGPEHLQRDE